MTAPAITTQPVDAVIAPHRTATFSVVATGTPTLAYQWYRGATIISGATSSSYTTPTLELTDNGNTYHVVITNGDGNVTSRSAQVTVRVRYSDGYIIPTGTTDWKKVETGPGNLSPLTATQLTNSCNLRLRCEQSSPATALAQTWNKIGTVTGTPYAGGQVAPPTSLTPKFWESFSYSDDFPLRDKDYLGPARVSWAGVYPTNLRMLIVVWDGPVTILDRTKIEGALVSSVEGRVMHLLLPDKVAIDGSTTKTVTFKTGSIGVFGLTKDTNIKMYDSPALPDTGTMLSADTLNDTTDVAQLQDSVTKDSYIHAFFGTHDDIIVTAQCWQQFESKTINKDCSGSATPLVGWALCYQIWGTTTPMDLFPPEQLFVVEDVDDFGTGLFTASLVNDLPAGTNTGVSLDLMGAGGAPLRITAPHALNYTPTAVGSTDANKLPAGTIITFNACVDTSLDGNSAPVGGGGGETVATAIVYGGNCAETASPFSFDKPDIYALARFPKPLDPKKAVDWTKLDLPITFAHGDPIPQRLTAPTVGPTDAKWPDGVGLARLCRGSPPVGSSSWDADIYEAVPLAAIPCVAYYGGFKSASNSEVYVYFNKPPIAVNAALVQYLDGGTTASPAVSSAIVTQSTVKVTLATAAVIQPGSIVRFLPGALTTSAVTDSSGVTTNVTNTSNIDVTINTDVGGQYMTAVAAVANVTARDAIYAPAESNTTLKIYFTGPLSAPPSASVVTLSGAASTITVSGGTLDTSDKSLVLYTLSLPTDAQLTGSITVSVGATGGATLAQGDIPSGATVLAAAVPLHVKAAKNCYVLVVNRFTENGYKKNDIIQVVPTSYINLADSQSTPQIRACYDSRLIESLSKPTSTTYPWVQILAKGGQRLISTPDKVYGVKRKVGEAKFSSWTYAPRRAIGYTVLGSGATAGKVTGAFLSDYGSAYDGTPTVTVSAAPSGGTTAAISASVVDNYIVEGAYITNVGAGYESAPSVTVSGGGGSGAVLLPVMRDGKVVKLTVQSRGSGYTSPATITIAAPYSGGTTATAVAVMGRGCVQLTVTNQGSGYLTPPTISISLPNNRPYPMPPSPADDSPAQYPDGLGWGLIQGGSLTGGLAVTMAALICHDDRSLVPWGLMGDGGGTVPYSRTPDSVLSWFQTDVRLTSADANADGVISAWVPMAGGG